MQDVAVAGVVVDGDEVHVGVYGGAENVCASVTFSFPDDDERAEHVRRLLGWASEDAPLSLLVDGPSVRLFSERALFRRADQG